MKRLVPVLSAALLVAAASGLAIPARAADKPREASFGQAKPGGPLLSPAQLRECLSQQERIRANRDATVKQQATLNTTKAEIERLGPALKEQLTTLDRTSAEAVAAYNAQVEARDKLIDEYQEAVPAFNTKVDALKTDQSAFAKACENRRYMEDDEIAIRKGK